MSEGLELRLTSIVVVVGVEAFCDTLEILSKLREVICQEVHRAREADSLVDI